ncbi:uncharacterized protein ARMOST_10175 [Armillaria ostoyae]|uniref:Uncharacterized protein n=1 Tax=Armillaria ostoyae TaxID=47428 RepID=A0A284RDK2_ARMOS|nr:uncharacterized protein ARMOST_10175 [Armillaria ostoyae]
MKVEGAFDPYCDSDWEELELVEKQRAAKEAQDRFNRKLGRVAKWRAVYEATSCDLFDWVCKVQWVPDVQADDGTAKLLFESCSKGKNNPGMYDSPRVSGPMTTFDQGEVGGR